MPTAGQDFFTTALINELGRVVHSSKPVSVADVHCGIIHRLERHESRIIFDRDNKIRTDSAGKPALTSNGRITPIHICLSETQPP